MKHPTKSLMQQALGSDWDTLPASLKAHYRAGPMRETGLMDIEYPGFMQPVLSVLRYCGALLNRRGQQLPTVVEKHVVGERQHWLRTIHFPDGRQIQFKSYLVADNGNQLIEFVNPLLGLKMSVRVEGERLHYDGICFVLKLGNIMLPIPEWLALGHTTIVEEAVCESQFRMDFRLTHSLFGQVFRYAGTFDTRESAV